MSALSRKGSPQRIGFKVSLSELFEAKLPSDDVPGEPEIGYKCRTVSRRLAVAFDRLRRAGVVSHEQPRCVTICGHAFADHLVLGVAHAYQIRQDLAHSTSEHSTEVNFLTK
jgi:hypothetical protein